MRTSAHSGLLGVFHGSARWGAGLAYASVLVGLPWILACSPVRPHFLGDESLSFAMMPGDVARLTITANAVAVAGADLGLAVELSGLAAGPGDLELRLVPDDARLDEIVLVTPYDYTYGGEVEPTGEEPGRVRATVRGGELATICEGLDPCVLGFTLELVSAGGEVTFSGLAGIERDQSAGTFASYTPFDPAARATVALE